MADENLFIVIEGLDGAGKSSIARQLHDSLAPALGDKVLLTYEPHDPSAAGNYIRDVLSQRRKACPRTLALAFALNRSDHLHSIINPFLNAPDQRVLISDRYVLSSLVYQSTGGLTINDIQTLNRWARQPDITLYLAVSPRSSYARLRRRPKDRELFERNLDQRAEKYQACIARLRNMGETIIDIDANPPLVDVFSSVLHALKEHAPPWLLASSNQLPLFID